MRSRNYIQLGIASVGLLLATVSFAQASPAVESRRGPILAARAGPSLNIGQVQAEANQESARSAEQAGKRAMFTLIATTSILSLLTLTVLGWVAHKAHRHEPKVSFQSQAGISKAWKNPVPSEPSNSLIYTSDLYDVASRGHDGQAIKFQRTRDWHYDKETPQHMPQPTANVLAQARAARSNQVPPRSVRPRPTPPQKTHSVTSPKGL